MSDTKKYYWLKLKRDFFKRHDIKIIESMENGKDYVLFYMKLLLESIDHEGTLRFSETIPYNEKMLSTITDTNIDIVRSAVKIFSELGMMDRLDDGSLYMSHVKSMIGKETSDAARMRGIRESKKQVYIEQGESEQCSKMFKKRSPELEKEIDIEIEKDKKREPPIFSTSAQEESQEEPGDDFPITEPAPKRPKSVYNPNDLGVHFEKIRDHWNSKPGLPGFQRLFMNLFPEERESFLRMMIHGADKLCEAIDHYSAIIDDPVKYDFDTRYAFKSLPNFLKAAEKYFDPPREAKAGKQANPAEEDFSRYNALMRKE